MCKSPALIVGLSILIVPNLGCWSRAIREGAGAAMGASGVMVELQSPSDLSQYRGLDVAEIESSAGLPVPGGLQAYIKDAFADAAADVQLRKDATPGLRIEGQIIHYEGGDAVDKAIGPLQEVLVRTRLLDAESKELLGVANLIGRSKALSSSGRRNLAEGTGKALKKWFEEHGLEEPEE